MQRRGESARGDLAEPPLFLSLSLFSGRRPGCVQAVLCCWCLPPPRALPRIDAVDPLLIDQKHSFRFGSQAPAEPVGPAPAPPLVPSPGEDLRRLLPRPAPDPAVAVAIIASSSSAATRDRAGADLSESESEGEGEGEEVGPDASPGQGTTPPLIGGSGQLHTGRSGHPTAAAAAVFSTAPFSPAHDLFCKIEAVGSPRPASSITGAFLASPSASGDDAAPSSRSSVRGVLEAFRKEARQQAGQREQHVLPLHDQDDGHLPPAVAAVEISPPPATGAIPEMHTAAVKLSGPPSVAPFAPPPPSVAVRRHVQQRLYPLSVVAGAGVGEVGAETPLSARGPPAEDLDSGEAKKLAHFLFGDLGRFKKRGPEAAAEAEELPSELEALARCRDGLAKGEGRGDSVRLETSLVWI